MSQIDSSLQSFRIHYYSALKQPSEIFEQMLATCTQIIQAKDQIISQLKQENQQLSSQIALGKKDA